jgi:hypothetical protein
MPRTRAWEVQQHGVTVRWVCLCALPTWLQQLAAHMLPVVAPPRAQPKHVLLRRCVQRSRQGARSLQVVDVASASAEAARQLPEDWEDDLEQVLDICGSKDPSLTSVPLDSLRRRFALIYAELPTALQRNVVELSSRCPWLMHLQPSYVRRVFVQLQDLCALREDWEVQSLALRPGVLALFLRSNELVLLRLEYLLYLNDGAVTLQQAITEPEAAWQEAFPLFQFWLVHGSHPPRHRQQQQHQQRRG